VDSTNILQTFITNNIFLDEIVMYRPARIANEANNCIVDPSNWYSEIPFAAIPYLKKYMKDSRTKIRIIDVDSAIDKFFQDPNLSTHFTNIASYQANSILKTSMKTTDKDWNKLYLKNVKICHITGAEKPFVYCTDGIYSFNFYDDPLKTENYANESFSTSYSHIVENQIVEPFYWTANLPQLVIKQCQLIKQAAQEDNEAFKRVFPHIRAIDEEIMKIIYPSNVLEVRSFFNTGKAVKGLGAAYEEWFYRTMGYNIVGQFKDIVQFSTSNIADRFFKRDIRLPPSEKTFPKLSYNFYFSKRYYF
jgi:hypothetical protein